MLSVSGFAFYVLYHRYLINADMNDIKWLLDNLVKTTHLNRYSAFWSCADPESFPHPSGSAHVIVPQTWMRSFYPVAKQTRVKMVLICLTHKYFS